LPRLSAILDQMNLAGDWRRTPRLVLDPATNAVTICGRTRTFDPMDFVWLRLLATAAAETWTCPQDIPGQPPGAFTIARLLFGQPDHGNLARLRRWFEQAVVAGGRGDAAMRRSSSRTAALGEDAGDADGHESSNLGRKILLWQEDLRLSATAPAPQRRATLRRVWSEIEDSIKSFNGLRSQLAERFGTPLAEGILPRLGSRLRRADGLSQAAYALAGAGPGAVRVLAAGEGP
jgi:hypothetical protein